MSNKKIKIFRSLVACITQRFFVKKKISNPDKAEHYQQRLFLLKKEKISVS
jgi:hypothetical protein